MVSVMGLRSLKSVPLLVITALLVTGCAKVPVVNLLLAGNKNVEYQDKKSCVPFRLKRVVNHTSRKFGKVVVTSTKREVDENRRKGGAKKSYHLNCQAVDFSVKGDRKKVLKFLKNHGGVGGYSAYNSHYHVDTGPRRTW